MNTKSLIMRGYYLGKNNNLKVILAYMFFTNKGRLEEIPYHLTGFENIKLWLTRITSHIIMCFKEDLFNFWLHIG